MSHAVGGGGAVWDGWGATSVYPFSGIADGGPVYFCPMSNRLRTETCCVTS